MGRGNSLVFGKIALHSEGLTMEELVKTLDRIIERRGYPEEKKPLPTVAELAEEIEEVESGPEVEEEEEEEETEEGMPWKVK